MRNVLPAAIVVLAYVAMCGAYPKVEPVQFIDVPSCDTVCKCSADVDELLKRVAALEAKLSVIKSCDCEHAKESHVDKQAEKASTQTSPPAASQASTVECANGQCYRTQSVQSYPSYSSGQVRRLFGRW